MTEAKHSPLQITRAKLMHLPKDELVTELLGALEVVVRLQTATSLHGEIVAALEATKGRIMNARMDLALNTKKACGVALTQAIVEIDSVLQKAKQQ